MVVTERLEHVDRLGSFIYNLCRGKDTYKLQRRDRILGTFTRCAPGPRAPPRSNSPLLVLQVCRNVKRWTASGFVTSRAAKWWRL